LMIWIRMSGRELVLKSFNKREYANLVLAVYDAYYVINKWLSRRRFVADQAASLGNWACRQYNVQRTGARVLSAIPRESAARVDVIAAVRMWARARAYLRVE